jgi:hypothetical protein
MNNLDFLRLKPVVREFFLENEKSLENDEITLNFLTEQYTFILLEGRNLKRFTDFLIIIKKLISIGRKKKQEEIKTVKKLQKIGYQKEKLLKAKERRDELLKYSNTELTQSKNLVQKRKEKTIDIINKLDSKIKELKYNKDDKEKINKTTIELNNYKKELSKLKILENDILKMMTR